MQRQHLYRACRTRFVCAGTIRHHEASYPNRHPLIAGNIDKRRVVFSDLDGTLLDHDTYDWRPTAPMLDELRRRGIPVVLVSSKTMPELERLRRALASPDPVIAENGAAVDVPEGYFSAGFAPDPAVVDRATLQRQFRQLRDEGEYDCVSFAELGDAGIARVTGLAPGEAALANRRQASEPVLWNDTDSGLAAFAAAAEARGLRCTRGGRFVHLTGPVDKADAVIRLRDAYRREWPGAVVECIALGDGPNDLGMLRVADVAVVIPGRHGQPMPLEGHARVLRPAAPGPAGWAAAMQELLDSWQLAEPTG